MHCSNLSQNLLPDFSKELKLKKFAMAKVSPKFACVDENYYSISVSEALLKTKETIGLI